MSKNCCFFPSFDAEKSNLELHLQSIKDEVVSGFTSEIQDASCLQNKLCDLEVDPECFHKRITCVQC